MTLSRALDETNDKRGMAGCRCSVARAAEKSKHGVGRNNYATASLAGMNVTLSINDRNYLH